MELAQHPRRRNPWGYVPSLYVLQGMPYFVVHQVANVFTTQMGVDLSTVGRSSSDFLLPWSFKALWSPLVDLHGTKRAWILWSGLCVCAAILLLSWAVLQSAFMTWIALACLVLAVCAATNDIATDGYYMLSLDKRQQELFVGTRNAFFRIGRIAVTGGAVGLAGQLAKPAGTGVLARGLSVQAAWSWALIAAACAYAALTLLHVFSLPRPTDDRAARSRSGGGTFREAVRTFYARPALVQLLLFIFFFRLAELLLTNMLSPFLLKPRAEGGLALSADQLALAYGTVGVAALITGGVIGGLWIAHSGLRRCLWPMAILMHAPNFLYAWAASAQPGVGAATLVVGIEQLGYGLGLSAYMAVLLSVARGSKYATTHYAIATGLMALSAWFTSRYSGDLVAWLGFERFFWTVGMLGLAGLLVVPLAPIWNEAPAAEQREQ
jgi:MFS transporter, PAT family, beta-lactamase induction signal transducer AmpG